MTSVGVMLPRHVPPSHVATVARASEQAGFDEVWVVEDCFYTGGLTSAAIALSATDQITVGIGILPAVVRNPAFTAMEAATLVGAFPGRVHLGIGHGVAAWMEQVGARPASWLASLEQTTTAVRDLLRGHRVSTRSDYVSLDEVQLEFPPAEPPPISLGVRGPKSIALAGRVADGLILAEPTPVEYIAAARKSLDANTSLADSSARARLTAYTWAGAGADEALHQTVTDAIRSGSVGAHLAPLDEDALDHANAVQADETTLSQELLDRLVIRGNSASIRAGVDSRGRAGADCVVLVATEHEIQPLIAQITRLGQAAVG